MRSHFHSDLMTGLYIVIVSAVGFNLIRMGSGWLATHGSPTIGSAIGGFFTFGGK